MINTFARSLLTIVNNANILFLQGKKNMLSIELSGWIYNRNICRTTFDSDQQKKIISCVKALQLVKIFQNNKKIIKMYISKYILMYSLFIDFYLTTVLGSSFSAVFKRS